MMLYAQTAGRRAAQVAGDLVALLLIVIGVVVAVALHDAIAGVGRASLGVQRSGSDLASTLGDIGSKLGAVPLIGSSIRAPFDSASDAGTTLAAAGSAWQTGFTRVADLAGWSVALIVVLVVLVGWVRPRLVGARRRAVIARLDRESPDRELLALRALANRPARQIAAVHPSAAAAWRRGDAEVIDRLAALELRAAGVRPR